MHHRDFAVFSPFLVTFLPQKRSRTLIEKNAKKPLPMYKYEFQKTSAFFGRFSSVLLAFFWAFFQKTLFMYKNEFKKTSAFFERFLGLFRAFFERFLSVFYFYFFFRILQKRPKNAKKTEI